jgi:predicted metal-dependent peptidase
MAYDICENKIHFERPKEGCFNEIYMRDCTAENVYAHLIRENADTDKIRYFGRLVDKIPADLKEDPDQEARVIELTVNRLLKNALEKAGKGRHHYIPAEFTQFGYRETKILPWNKLLCEFLTEQEDEESSYMTPERKYIHMDMIVPGTGREDELGNIWAFIDSSGSIDKCDLEQFITQLCRITKEFRCCFNIAFWDDGVSMVYQNVRTAEQLLKCVPHSRGGTNINCIYSYLNKEHIKPDVMLVLTDGYYGELTEKPGRLKKSTILVISEGGCNKGYDNGVGKLATL